MKCSNCNVEFVEDDKYCSYCGKELVEEKNVPKCFNIFAKLGFILGLVSLGLISFYGLGIFFADHAIVFSALGKKSKNHRKMAKAGLTISIISLILNVIIFSIVVCIVIMEILIYMFIMIIYGR